jgi:hypothetical protein
MKFFEINTFIMAIHATLTNRNPEYKIFNFEIPKYEKKIPYLFMNLRTFDKLNDNEKQWILIGTI